jgi:hypothetical protein
MSSELGTGKGSLQNKVQNTKAVRIIAPRCIPVRLFSLIMGSFCLVLSLSVGLGLGIAYHELYVQLGAVMVLVAAGCIVGVPAAIGIERLIYKLNGDKISTFWELLANVLSYSGGGVVGAIIALFLRPLLPFAEFVPFSNKEDGYVILIVLILWLLLGLIANHMEVRAAKRDQYNTMLEKTIAELQASRKLVLLSQGLKGYCLLKIHSPR